MIIYESFYKNPVDLMELHSKAFTTRPIVATTKKNNLIALQCIVK